MKQNELEQRAARLEELPENLTLPQAELYLGLQYLYGAYRRGQLTKDKAVVEKKRLLTAYEHGERAHRNYVEAFRKRQETFRSCEELIHQINHEMKNENPDKQLLLTLMAQVVDNCFGTKYGEKL